MRISTAVLLMSVTSAFAAPPGPDTFLKDYAQTRRFLAGRPSRPKISPDGKKIYFLRSEPRSARQSLFVFDVETGKTAEVLSPESLSAGGEEKLSAEEKARLERQRISARGFTHYDLSPDGQKIVVALSGKLYLVGGGKPPVLLPTGNGALDPRFSRDGRYLGFVRDNDLYAVDLTSLKEVRVTKGGTAEKPNGLAEFVAQEEMHRFEGYWFSPDSSKVAYQKTDHAGMEHFTIVDPMHPESGSTTVPYPRVGTPNAAVALFVAPMKGGKAVQVKWEAGVYPYLATVKWPKKGPLTLVVQNRAQTEELVLSADVQTGATTPLLKETDAAWINLDQDFPRWSSDGQSFLWLTERNGGPEVEEWDTHGQMKARWVSKEAGFSDAVGWDEASGIFYFVGSPNPTEQEVYRVEANAVPQRLQLQLPEKLKGPDWQTAKLSEDGKLLVVEASSVSSMPRSFVFRASDGANLGELPEVAEEPPFIPNVRFLEVGPRKFRSAVILPRNFQPGKKLPVIVEVYGGPTVTEVKHTMRENLILQWLADQGFIVAKFDGRGTPRRGREWERTVKGDFATTAVADQVEALQQTGAQVPEMDLSRVGIEGWSFGGYMTVLALLKRSDVYKAGVAGAPVVDFRDYDTHYTERYLGLLPENSKAYEVSSALSYVQGLKSPLLLIHGTADDNVYFFNSLKLSDALFKAGKPHEFLPLAGMTHMVPDPAMMQAMWTRVAEFFKAKL